MNSTSFQSFVHSTVAASTLFSLKKIEELK